jgi:Rieske Fe-S protein
MSDAHPAATPQAPAPAGELPRRTVLAGIGLGGAAAVLAGCATYDSGGGAAPQNPAPAAAPGKVLGATGDIPVGGGAVFADDKIVVTQPAKGTFVAFSAVCTHQGCTVSAVQNGTINCPCHGSKFRVADGSVAAGPAPKPLPKAAITVNGTSITLA